MIIKGKVIKGKKRGRALGFPTANVEAGTDFSIPAGIYAGRVIFNDIQYISALYVREDKIIEAHILDFEGDLYEQEIEIEIGKKIRENLEFKNDEEAIEQITKDISTTREYSKKVV